MTTASATFALKAGVWFRRARLVIVSPDSRANLARRQAETPLIALCRFPEPALCADRLDIHRSRQLHPLIGRDRASKLPRWPNGGSQVGRSTTLSFLSVRAAIATAIPLAVIANRSAVPERRSDRG